MFMVFMWQDSVVERLPEQTGKTVTQNDQLKLYHLHSHSSL